MPTGVYFYLYVSNNGYAPISQVTLEADPLLQRAFSPGNCPFLNQTDNSLQPFSMGLSCSVNYIYTEEDISAGPQMLTATLRGVSGNTSISTSRTVYAWPYLWPNAGMRFQNCTVQGMDRVTCALACNIQ